MIGLDKFAGKIARLRTMQRNQFAATLGSVLVKMDADVKRTIQTGSRSGRIYRKSKRVLHQASAQGEAPKTDTGALVAGFYFGVTKDRLGVTGFLGNRATHAAPLEFKPESMGGRPFMNPLVKRWRDFIRKELNLDMRVMIRND